MFCRSGARAKTAKQALEAEGYTKVCIMCYTVILILSFGMVLLFETYLTISSLWHNVYNVIFLQQVYNAGGVSDMDYLTKKENACVAS